MSRGTTLVVAAVVVRDGAVLLTQRKAGSHLAGTWEFPGGKVEPDEDPRVALARELAEEIDVEARVGEIVDVTFHRYAEKSVLLLFFSCALVGAKEPRAVDVAAVRWATPAALDALTFPEADVAILEKVRTLLAP